MRARPRGAALGWFRGFTYIVDAFVRAVPAHDKDVVVLLRRADPIEFRPVELNLDSAVETQWDMRTKIALTIQLLIHGDFNCAAVETGESRKMSRCSRPQPTITFSATESFHNQLRNPG